MRHPRSWLRRIGTGSELTEQQFVQTCVGREAIIRRDEGATLVNVIRRTAAGSVANNLARQTS